MFQRTFRRKNAKITVCAWSNECSRSIKIEPWNKGLSVRVSNRAFGFDPLEKKNQWNTRDAERSEKAKVVNERKKARLLKHLVVNQLVGRQVCLGIPQLACKNGTECRDTLHEHRVKGGEVRDQRSLSDLRFSSNQSCDGCNSKAATGFRIRL